MAVGFRFTEVKTLTHFTDIENGVGEEMIHLLGAIMKTCSLAGINSKLHNLWITAHYSKKYAPKLISSKSFLVVCLP
jgi:hypothetical protein